MKKPRHISTLLLFLGLSITPVAANTFTALSGIITSVSLLIGGNAQFDYQSASGTYDDVYNALDIQNGIVCSVGDTLSAGSGNKDGLAGCYNTTTGDRLSLKAYGSLLNDGFNAIAILPNGYRVYGGYTKSFGAIKNDFWYVVVDEDGNVVYACEGGSNKNDVVKGLTCTPSGFASISTTNGLGAQSKDGMVQYFNYTGSSDPFATASCLIGGTNVEDGRAIAAHDNGDTVSLYKTQSYCPSEGALIVTLDGSCNKIWGTCVCPEDDPLSTDISHIEGYDLTVDPDRNSYVASYVFIHKISETLIEGYPYVFQVTSSGEKGWTSPKGEAGVIDQKAYSIDYLDGILNVGGYTRRVATNMDCTGWMLNATTGEMLCSGTLVSGSSNDQVKGVKFSDNGVFATGYKTEGGSKGTFITEVNNCTSPCNGLLDLTDRNDSFIEFKNVTDQVSVTPVTVPLFEITNDVDDTDVSWTGSETCPS